jgi:hypothetical protein
MNAIACILPGPSPLVPPPAALTAPLKLAADFAKASKAPATQAAYDPGARRAGFPHSRPPLRRCAASWPMRRPVGSAPAR